MAAVPGARSAPAAAGLTLGASVAANGEDFISRSHCRSREFGLRPNMAPDFASLTLNTLRGVRDQNQMLCRHAVPVMEVLHSQIINTHSMVVLTDDCGVIIHSIGDGDFLARAEKVALKPGVSWAEQTKGTNAIGTALVEENPTLVHANEHFLQANQFLTCSAVPIFSPRGDVLGVLDVTGDQRGYNPHTMALVKLSARMIENHLVSDNPSHHLLLRFHQKVEFLGTLAEAIIAIAPDGRIVGSNRAALELTGLSAIGLKMSSLAGLFGTTVGAMHEHLLRGGARPVALHLADGRELFALPHLQRPDPVRLQVAPPVARPFGTEPAAQASPAAALGQLPASTAQAKGAVPRDAALTLRLDELDSGDPQMHGVVGKVRRVIDRDIPVLILGETGTGKELLARAIHAESQRNRGPFVAVNCASIPESLIESELFGYEEGAFTGARRRGAVGKIAQAHRGTLFLDEIGDMPLALQARLLRVLQERQVVPLQAQQPVSVDITVICATHRSLRDMIAQGEFREDLYYRLNGLALRLPALRERQDLAALIERLLALHSTARPMRLSHACLGLLRASPWPGNVRQLSNVLRTACVMAADDGLILPEHLPDDFLDDTRRLLDAQAVLPAQPPGPGATTGAPLTDTGAAATAMPAAARPGDATLTEAEEQHIRAVLERAGGNISVAARQLGISRNTIYRKLRWNTPAR